MRGRDNGLESQKEDERARLKLVASAASAGVFAAVIFAGWPGIDLAVTSLFNLGPRHFVLNDFAVVSDFRTFCNVITWLAVIVALLGVVLAVTAKRYLFGLGMAQWLFLALVLIIGPGLLVNEVLKGNWPRPRPINIVEFGGPNRFTPVLARSGQCKQNCSFVSGEASSIYALGFAVAMLIRRRRAALIGLALVAGSLIGIIRIGQGGHFPSDVIFAAVFMAMTVALVHWLAFHPFFRFGLKFEHVNGRQSIASPPTMVAPERETPGTIVRA